MEFYGSCHDHTDRSNFRLRDSINSLEELCWYAADELKHDFIAITDHETIATAIDCQDVEKKIREKYPNFKVIRGNEIYLCRDGLCKENYIRGEDKFYHFILLARDLEGHRQIREISTRAWSHCFTQGKMIRVPTYYQDLIDIVGSNPGHVIFSTACIGSKPSQLILDYANNPSEEKWLYIKEWIKHISAICGKENFFLETQPSHNKEQLIVNKLYKQLSEELDFPVVISLDAHYLKKEDEPIHHAFLTAQEGDRETSEFYASTYMMSREEIHSYMDESLGRETVSRWMNNTKKIYDLCEDYDLTKPTRIVYIPLTIDKISYEDFLTYKDKIHELDYFYNSKFQENRDLAAAIVKKIQTDPEQYDNELTYEAIDDNLKAIRLASEKMNTQWSAYLLNLRDYVNVIWKKGNSLMGPARGCFYPTEKVLLSNGQEKEIQNIQKGDLVINHNGSINEVLNVLSYDISETCYIIKGKGKEPIHCTYNHQLWIKRCKHCENPSYKNSWCKESCRRHNKCPYEKTHEVKFVPAYQIEVGDMLAYPKPKLPPLKKEYVDLSEYLVGKYYFVEDEYIGYYVGNNTVKKGKVLKRFIPIDSDLAYLCGVFIGDGWTTTDSESEIGIAFNSEAEKDLKSLERCINILKKYGLETTLVKSPIKKLIQLKFYSKVWWHFFRDNFGKNTYEKHICDWLISSNTIITKSLLLGLMASDGHYDKDRICYDSVNLNLIKQVQMLWSSIGIFGNFKTREQSEKGWHISYKWSASGKQLEKLIKDFPLVQITPNKKFTRQDFLEDENCFYTIVESITTEDYKGKVYDLAVKNTPSYIINGSGVHNSGTGFLLLNMLGVTQINPLRETTKTYSFRFLNPERVSPLDVDLDIEGGKRPQVYKALQDTYGADRVSKVLTIRTEKSKSALLTACRGLKIDPDEAAYLASFIKADRGTARTLKQTFYGDEENDIPPDKTFQSLMTEKYPEVWKVAQKIENLCCGMGSHAGGVIFYDEPITNSTALMQTTNGDVITQYDLHTVERVGNLKIDLLSIEALDRMRAAIDLLVKYGYLNKDKTLRENYEEAVGIYRIERNDPKMWSLIHNHKIESLFQMEQQSGIKGIALVKPTSVDDLAALNAVIRLMVTEKGAIQPVDKFALFKKNPSLWYKEMDNYGVSKSGQKVLENILGISYGLCIQQEQFMMLVQQPEIGGFSLLWADRLRKAISKKKPKEYDELTKEFFKQTEEKGCEKALCDYVWNVLIAMNRGYGFNAAHTLAYSLVGLQEMNLAYKYPIIFWDTANLIVDSGAMNLEQEISLADDEDDTDDTDEKLKNSSMDYGKVASAIGKMKSRGLNFSLPDINKSDLTFSPEIERRRILYGMRGITRIGNQLIKDIIKNRPYNSIEDFLSKVKINKPQMINLIKSGAFDELYDCAREDIMNIYLGLIADKKKRITLQNMQMLIAKDLIPEELDFEKRLFNFNKYLKRFKDGDFYKLDVIAATFFNNNYDENLLTDIRVSDDDYSAKIFQKTWDAIYKKGMEPVREWMKNNQQQILDELNQKLLEDAAEKYTEGNISKWEMDSLSFYYHEHELANLKNSAYGIVDYFKLPEEPVIERKFTTKDGNEISLFRVNRIAGTVIDKDKNKNTVTLLTTTGVVTVKVWKSQFAKWDKQISERDADGVKHVIEKSFFTRGNKLIITGIRRDDAFIPKKYKGTEYPLFERIDQLNDEGTFILSSKTERADEEVD